MATSKRQGKQDASGKDFFVFIEFQRLRLPIMDSAASRCQEATALLRSLQASYARKFLIKIKPESHSLLTS